MASAGASKQDQSRPSQPRPLSELPSKLPRRRPTIPQTTNRIPGISASRISWSTIAIAVLVAVSAARVYRRDGAGGVWEILRHDLGLFGGILPRVLPPVCSAPPAA